MMSQPLRRALTLLSMTIMIGSLVLIVLGAATALYFDGRLGTPVSDGPVQMFLESRLGDLIMALVMGGLLRTLLSIDERMARSASMATRAGAVRHEAVKG